MRALILLCLLALPVVAQAQTAGPGAVPLPPWFVEIDTAKKGEVARADFLKYRMKSFDDLDADKDGKISLEEFLKLAEPPYSSDQPGGPNLEERRNRIRAAFQSLDLNSSGFIERAEAEAPIQSEFNQYDTDRDNKITEPEIRLIMQRLQQRQMAERQQAEAERRKGLMALNDLIDMQMRDADKLDKNNDGKISQQEYLVAAGPADGPQSQNQLPYEIRKKLVLIKFNEIDTNKDGIIERPELTAYSVKEFLETDTNKDRFLDQEEIKKFQEAEAAKTQELIKKMLPPPAPPRPAQPQQRAPAPAPSGPPTGLPQGTR
ncbi:MAG: EF-hand domain-containing protein [Rhodospirillales bacterium]|nr:EF-hand domain-containing protein [Rhodospirillales bacterium]